MVKLRQTANPADKASWKEHFYTGYLPVKNGVVETDNLVWVHMLMARGYTIINEDESDVASAFKAQEDEDAVTAERKEDLEKVADVLDEEAVSEEVPALPQVPLDKSKVEDADAKAQAIEQTDVKVAETKAAAAKADVKEKKEAAKASSKKEGE